MDDNLVVLWRLVGAGPAVECRIVRHPGGLELREELDHSVIRSAVFASYAELFERSREWCVSWQRRGWRMVDPLTTERETTA